MYKLNFILGPPTLYAICFSHILITCLNSLSDILYFGQSASAMPISSVFLEYVRFPPGCGLNTCCCSKLSAPSPDSHRARSLIAFKSLLKSHVLSEIFSGPAVYPISFQPEIPVLYSLPYLSFLLNTYHFENNLYFPYFILATICLPQ